MVEFKNSNPKDAVGVKKVPFSTVSAPVIAELGLAMLEGDRKYGRHNYRAIGVRSSVYYDAMFRHITAWWEGEDIDPDSGLSHVTKAMGCLLVLRDAMINNKLNDDRPPRVANGWTAELNKKAAAIIEKYPNPVMPYTEKRVKQEFLTQTEFVIPDWKVKLPNNYIHTIAEDSFSEVLRDLK